MKLSEELHPGDLCAIRYKSPSGNGRWYEWVAIAVYLGDGPPTTAYGRDLLWSLRPHAGSMPVPVGHLTSVMVVKRAAERLGKRGDEGAKLPRRLTGAVPPPARRPR